MRGNGWPSRDPVSECRPPCVEDLLPMGAQVLGDALRCIDRHFWELRRQHGQTRPVIEMNMRKNDALDRLAEASSVGGGLCRVWQEELTVKDDELFRSLDDLCVGEEPILRADICVYYYIIPCAYSHRS